MEVKNIKKKREQKLYIDLDKSKIKKTKGTVHQNSLSFFLLPWYFNNPHQNREDINNVFNKSI